MIQIKQNIFIRKNWNILLLVGSFPTFLALPRSQKNLTYEVMQIETYA